MAAQHTPGPWSYGTKAAGLEHCDIANVYGVVRLPTEDGLGQGWGVISAHKPCFLVSQEEQTANAVLMSAAPDLLAAVKSALAFIEADHPICEPGTCIGEVNILDLHTGEPRAIDLSALRAAIAKAEGRDA